MDAKHNFAVLMAVYAKDDFELFEKAVRSVYENSIIPKEFILVQDGPIDHKLLEVINRFKEIKGFKHLRLETNQGLACALNFGLENASSEFIFRADADDYNCYNRFERQFELLVKGFDLVGSNILEINSSGNPIAVRKVPQSQFDIFKCISTRNPFNHMTVGFRRDFVKKVGYYPNIFLREDYGLWALMLSQGAKACNIPDVLVHATTGVNMYKRRGGLSYVAGEIKMQKFLVKLKLQTILNAFFIGFCRSIVFLLPSSIRGLIYKYLLREPVDFI
jgi:glycosyltransferase involved in cell wall biosynthesis